MTEDHPLQPTSPYAASKVAAELTLGLVLGLVAAAVFWGRAHSKQRANVQPPDEP